MQNREKIAARIKALLAKTTANGATEAEAMAAAEKAAELLQRYQLSMTDLDMQAEGVIRSSTKREHYKTLQLRDRLAASIAAFADCRVWLSTSQGTITFFGLRSDADFANCLLVSLEGFVRQSCISYMAGTPIIVASSGKMPRWEAEKAFALGCIDRINERLSQLAKERKAQNAPSKDGRSLIVVKNQLVTEAWAKLNMCLRAKQGSGAKVNDGGAFAAGRSAGDKASFGRPVNGGAGVALIGGK